MIGVVTHQGRKIECDREARLPVIEQELVTLVGVARAAEPRELAHRPQAASVSGRMYAARVRINSGHPERFCTRLHCVERSIDGLDFFFGIVKTDIAQLALLVLLAPLGNFLPQQTQLGALLFDLFDQRIVGRGLGGARAFQFRHLSSSPRTSSPLWRNN